MEELCYTTTEKELIMSTNFFKPVKVLEQLDYDVAEVSHFITGGFFTTKDKPHSKTFIDCHREKRCK